MRSVEPDGPMLASRASGQQNPYLQGNINALGTNINQQLGQNLQQVGGQYMGAGQGGSSRQGIAEGLAIQGAQQQFSQGANQMLSQDYQNQGAMAQQYLGAQQQGLGNYLGGAGQLANLGMQGLNAPWNALQNYQGVLGSPIMTSQGSGFGKSSSFNVSGGMMG